MAMEKVDGREMTWRSLFPWTELFRGFQVALDLNKLLLAAAGILVMALGWWVLALIFGSFYSTKPVWPSDYKSRIPPIVREDKSEDYSAAWDRFKKDREQWNLMHDAARVGGETQYIEPADVAESWKQCDALQAIWDKTLKPERKPELDADALAAIDKLVENKDLNIDAARAKLFKDKLGKPKPGGKLSTMPWSEDRGPNPFLLVTGQAGIPWEPGHFWDWFIRDQLLVVLEPVVKLVRPLIYFFNPAAEGWPRLYFFLAFVWTVATWSVFGGAITRIAAVQVARGEKIGLMDAVNFTIKRIVSYLTAPLFPIGFITVLVLFAIVFGLVQMIPFVGDFVGGLLWVIPVILGLLVAVTLVGLVVGWPLMSPTISAEGTDSWEAVSRSFSYVFQKPFHYLWYCLVATAYGGVLIFFIGFMGSFTVYLAKWSVGQAPGSTYTNREPTYLMVYAPESFGWRPLLLQGAKVDGRNVVQNGRIDPGALDDYKKKDWYFWHTAGAGLVSLWLGLIFLLMIGFGYSFFWCSITIIYMLLRKVADGAELDEVYLEEDETDGVFGGQVPTPAAPSTPAKQTQPLTMVEPPALRPTPPPAPTPPSVPPPPPTAVPEPPPAPAAKTQLAPASPPDSPPRSEPEKDKDDKEPPV